MTNFLRFIRNNSSFAKLACDELLFVEYTCPIKETKIPIWSETHYLAYVLSGKKIWSTHDASHELKEGDAIFVARGAHFIEQIKDKEFCVLIFFITDELLEEVIEQSGYSRKRAPGTVQKVIPIEVNEPLQVYIQSMAAFFTQKQSPSKQLLNLKFKELIAQLLTYQSGLDLFHFFDSVTASPERKFRHLIESNIKFNFGLEEYAELAGMSVSSFKRYFKKVFGESPGHYLLHHRLSFAAMLLTKSAKNIQEVSYESGFDNPEHFTRMFNKKYKASPSKYREARLS